MVRKGCNGFNISMSSGNSYCDVYYTSLLSGTSRIQIATKDYGTYTITTSNQRIQLGSTYFGIILADELVIGFITTKDPIGSLEGLGREAAIYVTGASANNCILAQRGVSINTTYNPLSSYPTVVDININSKNGFLKTIDVTNANGSVVTPFPLPFNRSYNSTDMPSLITANDENPSYELSLIDTQNMKQVQDDSTIYYTFPTSITVSGNKTLQLSGKDDPVITLEYTNTEEPIITNT